MKSQIFGRKVGSGAEYELLIDSDGSSSSSKNADPAKLREFELKNIIRAIEMLQKKQVEGYVVFEDGSKKCSFTPDSIEQSTSQHITKLAETLFPGEDYFSRALASVFSEMHEQHLIAGGDASLVGIGDTLSTFTPRYVLMETTAGMKITEQRWMFQRKQLFEALEKFFLDGGLDKLLATQKMLLSELEAAGIEIEGRSILVEGLREAGRWHQAFIAFAITGIDRGVRLVPTASYDRRAVEEALQKADFSGDNIRQLKEGSHLFEIPRAGEGPWL